jgi:hypothetical protein
LAPADGKHECSPAEPGTIELDAQGEMLEHVRMLLHSAR